MMRLSTITLGIVALLVAIGGARRDNEGSALTTKRIADNAYVVFGGNGNGSNVGVFVGRTGIVLVDAMMSRSSPDLLQAIQGISDLPITHVLNTHGDADHSGGNEFFARLGAVIIGQANARFRQSYADSLFGEYRALSIDDETIEMYHVVSHAFDDAIIVFRESNVVFMGDTYTTSWHPTLYSGGLDGQLAAVELVRGIADSNTVVVPGHGTVTGRDALFAYAENTEMIVDRIGQLYSEGARTDVILNDPTFDQIMAAFNVDQTDVFVPRASRRRFVNRVLSTDFIDHRSPVNYGRYRGVFELDDGRVIELSTHEGRLIASSVGEFIVELVPRSTSEFVVRGSLDDAFTFTVGGAGQIEALSLNMGGRSATGKRQDH